MGYVNEGSVLAIGVLFIVLSLVTVAVRFVVRMNREQGVSVDDWLTIPSMVFVIGCSITMIVGAVTSSVGGHSPLDLGPAIATWAGEKQLLNQKLQFAFNIMQVLALVTIKLSVMFFYRRLFVGRSFNIVSWVLIGIIITWGVAFSVTLFAACGDSFTSYFQPLAVLQQDCIDTFRFFIVYAASDVLVDIGILLIPVPHVLRLQMPWSKKFLVLGILFLGSIAIACSIVRMVLFGQILGPGFLDLAIVGGMRSDDPVGIVSMWMFWGMLEIGIAIVAISLPVLRPMFRGFSPESVIGSVRSFISLRSMGSGNRSRQNVTKHVNDSESQTGITQYNADIGSSSAHVETYPMNSVPLHKEPSGGGEKNIVKATEIRQTSDRV